MENNVSKGADTRKYGCRVRGCNARYNRQDNLSRHMKESCDAQHKRVASTMNRRFCKQCERIFIRQCDFSRHMRSKHSDIDLGACDEEDTEQSSFESVSSKEQSAGMQSDIFDYSQSESERSTVLNANVLPTLYDPRHHAAPYTTASDGRWLFSASPWDIFGITGSQL